MAAAVVGGVFLSTFLQVLFVRMASPEVFNFLRGRKLTNGLLRKLKIDLLSVNVVLESAKEKQVTKPDVKDWLDELKDVVYDAEDILDVIATKALRCKLDAEFQSTASEVQKSISNAFNRFVKEIEPRIRKVLDKLEYLVKQKDVLGLREGVGGKPSERLPTTSLVEESDICGRDDDKETIINLLLSDDAIGNEIYVIAIVGMGGIGKTTLAQLVYNDNRVKEHFNLEAWVCVSKEFDVFKVTRTILEAVTSSTCNIKDLNRLQVTLKENLMGKKFLLILDDVWNENYIDWEVLRNHFKSGAQGSRVIVTTRNESVASAMRYKLDVDVWEKILKSELLDLSNDGRNILPALRLSYKYLPSQLKRCFAYCSIFPKDYVFEKNQLILLWMAKGFLLQPKNKTMEEVGDDYFLDLVSRSLFQQSSSDKSAFIVHDLVNDFAKFVSKQFSFRLESDCYHEIANKMRYLSYFMTRVDNFKKFEALSKTKQLCTFLPLKFPPKKNMRKNMISMLHSWALVHYRSEVSTIEEFLNMCSLYIRGRWSITVVKSRL